MVKTLSDGPGIDSRWCQWGFFFPVVPPTEPCALRLTQPLKVSTRDISWGKGGRCVWLTTYHPCSAETSRKSGALIYPEPLGPPRPVAGDLYFKHRYFFPVVSLDFSVTYSFRPHHGPGVDSALSENEYQEHILGVKAAVA